MTKYLSGVEAVGPNVRRWRERSGLFRGELAIRAGLHPGKLGRFERAEAAVPIGIAKKLARILGVSYERLLEPVPPPVVRKPGRRGRPQVD